MTIANGVKKTQYKQPGVFRHRGDFPSRVLSIPAESGTVDMADKTHGMGCSGCDKSKQIRYIRDGRYEGYDTGDTIDTRGKIMNRQESVLYFTGNYP